MVNKENDEKKIENQACDTVTLLTFPLLYEGVSI